MPLDVENRLIVAAKHHGMREFTSFEICMLCVSLSVCYFSVTELFLRSEAISKRQMSSSEEELEFSDEDSVDFEMRSSPEYKIEQESDGPSADLSTSEGKDAAPFAEEPLADE